MDKRIHRTKCDTMIRVIVKLVVLKCEENGTISITFQSFIIFQILTA